MFGKAKKWGGLVRVVKRSYGSTIVYDVERRETEQDQWSSLGQHLELGEALIKAEAAYQYRDPQVDVVAE